MENGEKGTVELSHIKWDTIFQAIGHPALILKPDHTIVSVNRAASKAVNKSPEELINHKCFEIFHGSKTPPERCPCEQVKKSHCLETEDMEVEALDGTYLVSCTPVYDDNGELIYIIHIMTDITKRKKAERSLAENLERIERIFDSGVRTLSTAVELRDPYTAGHQRRVTYLAGLIAAKLGLTEDMSKGLYIAGLLHDVGKIAIPAEILSKPGTLTAAEYDIMKTHPRIGYNILKQIEWSFPIADIVLQHHERMDGSGYDQKLHGSDIMLEARILAVVDVVEAMLSHRPYRPAHSMAETIDEIEKHKGVLYDAKIADICLRMLKCGEIDLDSAL